MIDVPLQSDRFCLSCRYALTGIVSNRCPECGRAFDPNDPSTTSPRASALTSPSLAQLSQITIVGCGVIAGIAFVFSATGFNPLILWLCAVPTAPILLLSLVAAALPSLSLSRRLRILGVLFPILFVSIVWKQWPLRMTFALHRPAMERLADQVQAGYSVTMPQQVGMFWLMNVQVMPSGNIGFQLTGGPGGGVFLVRHDPNARLIWNNTNWETNLGGGWYHVYED
jgi:hypothetical protein